MIKLPRIEKLKAFESNVFKINAKLRSFFGANVLHDEVGIHRTLVHSCLS